MKNFQNIIIATAIVFRIILAIPMTWVSIEKFKFLPEPISIFVGIATIVAFEFMLILLSVSNIKFRNNGMEDLANFFLIVVVILAGFASFFLQNLNDFYTIKFPYSTFIPLHAMNFVSIILLESVGFLHTKMKKLKQSEERMKGINMEYAAKKEQDRQLADLKQIACTIEKPKPEQNALHDANYCITATTEPESFDTLIAKGLDVKEIAERLGVNVSTVYRKIKRGKAA